MLISFFHDRLLTKYQKVFDIHRKLCYTVTIQQEAERGCRSVREMMLKPYRWIVYTREGMQFLRREVVCPLFL